MSDLRVNGSPGQCREVAGQLRDAHRGHERTARGLAAIAEGSSDAWQGIAADGFRRNVRELQKRASTLALISRELAAGLDLLADGLDAALADMARARAALAAVGITVDDALPPRIVITTLSADPDAAEAAYDRARAFIALARTVEASAQQAWYAVTSGVLRELGPSSTRVEVEEDEPDDPGLFGHVPGLDRLDDWLPSMPDLPSLPDLPIGPLPWPDLPDLPGTLKWLAGDGNPVVAGSREFLDQLLEDSGRTDLGLTERLARAGLVGWTTYAGGLGAGVVCVRFAPKVVPMCTKAGVSAGRWAGNWVLSRVDER